MTFIAKEETKKIIEFIRDYFERCHLKGAVLGISGGKDSAVVAALCVAALGKENVVGLTLPCHSNPTDKSDAELLAEHLGIELINIDLTETYDAFLKQIGSIGDFTDEELKNSNINIKPRLRMTSVYYMAALLSATRGGTYIVTGTSNKSELYVGYFTKGGDSVFDIGTICDLTVDEVLAVGDELNVPHQVLYKAPSDGLSGMTDEDKMGVKYKDIARVINGELTEGEEYEKIQKLHRSAAHKFNIPKYEKSK